MTDTDKAVRELAERYSFLTCSGTGDASRIEAAIREGAALLAKGLVSKVRLALSINDSARRRAVDPMYLTPQPEVDELRAALRDFEEATKSTTTSDVYNEMMRRSHRHMDKMKP